MPPRSALSCVRVVEPPSSVSISHGTAGAAFALCVSSHSAGPMVSCSSTSQGSGGHRPNPKSAPDESNFTTEPGCVCVCVCVVAVGGGAGSAAGAESRIKRSMPGKAGSLALSGKLPSLPSRREPELASWCCCGRE